jgi:competence protein ComEC
MLGTLRQCLTGLGLAAVVLFLGGCEHASRLDSSEPPVSPASSRDAAALVDAGGTLTAHFFDVGQGDCTLLAGPDFTIVIDAGRHDRQDVVPHLRAAGVESIDLLIGTHPHADHIGQIPQIMAAFPVAEVWMSGDTHTSRTFERALDAVLESGAGYHEPRAGENHHFGSAYVQVLHPEKVTGNLNDGSVSVRISFGNVAFVFTGDAEAESELAMLAGASNLRAQILQVGHHGSRTSSTLPFLQAMAPELAIYSAGTDNSYGHPHEEVIERLAAIGVAVYGTDKHGTIQVTTDGVGYEVSVDRFALLTRPGEVR